MKRTTWILRVLFVVSILLSLALPPSALHAGVSYTGNVEPDPSTWNSSSTWAYVGKTAVGTLTVDAASTLNAYVAIIAESGTGVGTVTVDGANSKWTNRGYLCIGRSGNGTLNITNGGAVSNDTGYIGDQGGTSTVTVDGTTRRGPTAGI